MTLAIKNHNFSSSLNILQVELRLFSPSPAATHLFYQTLHPESAPFLLKQNRPSTNFTTRTIDWMSSTRRVPQIAVIPSESANVGFGFLVYRENVHSIEKFLDSNQRPIEIETIGETFPTSESHFSEHWVTLLRSAQSDLPVEDYHFMGQWQKEQHGKGPVHFSSTIAGMLVEIYPLRKNLPDSIEFLIAVDHVQTLLDRLQVLNFEGARYQLIRQEDRKALLRDPDDRLVQLIEKVVNDSLH